MTEVMILSSKHSPWTGEPDEVEATTWWKPDGRGYTDRLEEAGLFSREEAERIVNMGSANGLLPPSAFIVNPADIPQCGLDVLPWNWAKTHLIPDGAPMQRMARLADWEVPRPGDFLDGAAATFPRKEGQ